MNSKRVARHIRALGAAKECAVLGASSRTIEYVTGLRRPEIRRLFFSDRAPDRRGRPPASPDWYHDSNLLTRAEASIFLSIYRRIRELGFGPADAVPSAYKHYLHVCSTCAQISFDRAFDLASHIDGIWLATVPSFSNVTCPTCFSEYVASAGAVAMTNRECPFCKLVRRYPRDRRLQASFPPKPVPRVSKRDVRLSALLNGLSRTSGPSGNYARGAR